MATSRLCSIADCGKPHYAKGWCWRHYLRQRRHGDPLKGGTTLGEPQAFLQNVALPYQGDECLVWPFCRTPKGYGEVRLNGRSRFVHRVVCEAIHGPPPTARHEAAHSCGNGHLGCVAPRHLRWATHAENRLDMIAHQRSLRGTRNPHARLTPADVRIIRKMDGQNQHQIARLFGVHPNTINAILRRRNWKWLD